MLGMELPRGAVKRPPGTLSGSEAPPVGTEHPCQAPTPCDSPQPGACILSQQLKELLYLPLHQGFNAALS